MRVTLNTPAVFLCFKGAENYFGLDFLDVPNPEMPGQIQPHLAEMGDEMPQHKRIAMRVVAIRIAALLKGGEA